MREPDKLVSVIIPVYKVENYLPMCVDSVLNQSYRNLEVILVDDGSPDNCPAICDEYAKTDKRIRCRGFYEGDTSGISAENSRAAGE